MASISKNVYTDNSDDTTDKYNNTYHRTINVKPDDVKPSIYINIYIYIYIDFNEAINDKYVKFKNDNHVRIPNYEKVFQTCMEIFLRLKKLKTLCRGHMLLVFLMTNKLLGRFTKKNFKEKKYKSKMR